jgi:N6-adenosine-specific RNA methylase IME4
MIQLPAGPFGIALINPPRRFKVRSLKGESRSASNHYNTRDTDDIYDLPISSILTKDAAIFLWATSPMLSQALQALTAWGFTYRSSLVWVKDRVGNGYWARNCHEMVLIGARGKFRAPIPAHRPDSVIEGQQREHSRKPVRLHEIIEAAWPAACKVVLFAREGRPGWVVWGNQPSNFDDNASSARRIRGDLGTTTASALIEKEKPAQVAG